ncbi:MAG TPA: TonB-dependent receptor, partial [Caulobacteraceae bacterium]|nr:TonB-dependent receptor [Caulobacteraceae bacterium]
NVTLGKELDKHRDEGGRLSVRYDAGGPFTATWMAEYQETSGPSARTYAPNGVTNFLTPSPPETFRTIRRDTDQHAETRQTYLSQDLAYQTDIGRFNLLAAYRNYKLTAVEDQDATAIDPADAPLSLRQVLDRDERIENFYGELLWTGERGPVSWVAGASYFNETFDFARTFSTSIDFNALADPFYGTIACGALLGGSFNPGDPTCQTIPGGPSLAFFTSPFPAIGVRTGRGGLPVKGTTIKTRAYSAFVELNYKLTDALTLIGDLRYTNDRKSLHYAQVILPTDPLSDPYLAALFANVLPPFTLDSRSTFGNWAPSVGFKYRASANVNLYGVISTGFRAGGFNTTSTSPSLIPYGQEDATNYELGMKTQWLDGRLGLNLAVFYMQQRNLVLAQSDPLAPPQFGFTYLANIGDARTYGVEFEGVARFTSWLSGAASVGYLDPKFTKGSSFGTSVKGQRIPYTRTWTFNARLNADIPLADDWRLVGDVNWRVERGGVLTTTRKLDDLDKLDLTGGIAKGGLRVVGYIDNATDDHVTEFLFNNGAEAVSYGRTYGVEVSYKF